MDEVGTISEVIVVGIQVLLLLLLLIAHLNVWDRHGTTQIVVTVLRVVVIISDGVLVGVIHHHELTVMGCSFQRISKVLFDLESLLYQYIFHIIRKIVDLELLVFILAGRLYIFMDYFELQLFYLSLVPKVVPWSTYYLLWLLWVTSW